MTGGPPHPWLIFSDDLELLKKEERPSVERTLNQISQIQAMPGTAAHRSIGKVAAQLQLTSRRLDAEQSPIFYFLKCKPCQPP
jgi:hypothetical protein